MQIAAQLQSLKYVSNVRADEATLLLYGEVGGADGINGNDFAYTLYSLEAAGIKLCKVRINSPGGSVLDGYSIFSAICNTRMRVDTYIDGMAASIAGVCAMAGKKVYMAQHALLMLHNPTLPDGSDQEMLDMIKSSLVQMFLERRNIPAPVISEMMDVETWLDAPKALALGFIDEIYANAQTPKLDPATMSPQAMFNILNNALIQNEDKMTDNHKELETMKAHIEALQTQLKNLEAENKALKEEKEASDKASAAALVDAAIADGKITAPAKDTWLKLAENNLESVKEAIAKIPARVQATRNSIYSRIDPSKNTDPGANGEKNYRWYEKNDPAHLKELYNSNRTEFMALLEADPIYSKFKS